MRGRVKNMNNKIMLPNYNKSILNLITSILKKYNVASDFPELTEIKEVMNKDYNNIVL